MIYGYLRVSSDKQEVEAQKQGVDKFAEQHQWEIDEYITDEGVSGGKDPSKRNLGPLLKKLKKEDIVICSEISRLGRDLYMVMDILHHAMETGCIIYTVKDRFVLGDDIQSKVLAFAFGLSAEIERQMIQQRTREGLRLRVKMGILLGRPPLVKGTIPTNKEVEKRKDDIIQMYKWGVPERRIAKNIGADRGTITKWLHRWGVKYSALWDKLDSQPRATSYKDGDYDVPADINKTKIKGLILQDLTIPQIADVMNDYTYEQVYDTIYTDEDLNILYRKHGQKKIKKKKL